MLSLFCFQCLSTTCTWLLLQAVTVRQPAPSASLVCGREEPRIQVSRLGRSGIMSFFPSNNSKKFLQFFFLLSFFFCAVGWFLQMNSYAGPSMYIRQEWPWSGWVGPATRPAFPYLFLSCPWSSIHHRSFCTEQLYRTLPSPLQFHWWYRGTVSFKTWHRT